MPLASGNFELFNLTLVTVLKEWAILKSMASDCGCLELNFFEKQALVIAVPNTSGLS